MSIRKRKWTTRKGEEKVAWVVDYTDQSGTRRLKTFSKKKEADAFSASTTVAISKGEHVADSATVSVAEAGDLWLNSCNSLERSTRDQYRQHLKLHIVPLIGFQKLTRLSVPSVRAFQDRLRAEGRSAAMVRRVTTSLGSILADAQERGLVARNVVREMSSRRTKGAPTETRKKKLQVGVDIPTRDEIRKIVAAAQGRWRPFIITAIFTGLRASELRGLRWSDLDLDRGVLHVRQRADQYQSIGMPKSEAGHRTVPLTPLVKNTLKEWRLQCPKGDLNLVFPTGKGQIEYHSNIVKRGWMPIQIEAGVTGATGNAKYSGLHSLRHFFASWCINRKTDGGLELLPKMVQERLGHSSIQMTMDVYGHLFPVNDDAKALAEAERDLLGLGN